MQWTQHFLSKSRKKSSKKEKKKAEEEGNLELSKYYTKEIEVKKKDKDEKQRILNKGG